MMNGGLFGPLPSGVVEIDETYGWRPQTARRDAGNAKAMGRSRPLMPPKTPVIGAIAEG
jgi:hypothetical protein